MSICGFPWCPCASRPLPAAACQGIDKRAARDAEGAAHRRLARSILQGCEDRVELLRINRARSSPPSATALGGLKPRVDPLLNERPLVLSKRPKEVEEQLPMRRGG